MLIRNIDVSRGLANGTRMQIIRFSKQHLICRILTGPNKGRIEFIHRINIEHGVNKRSPLKFRRLQFPVRVCFAMTVNKAQGQSLKRMGLNLELQQCFSHGQPYVALSRVSRMSGIRVFSPTSSAPNRILNIVYKPILEHVDLLEESVPANNDDIELARLLDQSELFQTKITDFMIPPQDIPNRTELDVIEHMNDEHMEIEVIDEIQKPSTSKKKNDAPREIVITAEIRKPSSAKAKGKQLPSTPRNRRRAYIQNVDGDGNCFFRYNFNLKLKVDTLFYQNKFLFSMK